MADEVALRTVWVRVYLPALLYGLGQGAIAPIIALSARDLGASVGSAGLIVALLGVGQVLADVPAGALAARIGERRAMLAAGAMIAVALVLCAFALALWVLALGIFMIGLAGAVWMLARQAYLAEVVSHAMRARALSALGGVNRIGMFIGPFLGAIVVKFYDVQGPYLLYAVSIAVALIVLIRLPDPPGSDLGTKGRGSVAGVLSMARESLPILRTLGLGILMIGAVRASRQVVIPLWAEHLGLSPATTSVVFGIAGAVDMLLFYPAGLVMDRFGRNWIAVPCMGLLGLSLMVLPLSTGLTSIAVVAVLIGIGNGLGSGLVMTLGADLSPPGRRPEFLGAWRLCADLGTATGPVLVSAITAAVALSAGIATVGAVGLVSAGLLAYWIPRHIPKPGVPASSPDRDSAS